MRADRIWSIIRFLITAAAMLAVWLMFTASLDTFSLVAGAVGSTLVAALTYDVFIAKHQAKLRFFIPNPLYLLVYLFVMLFYIYSSSVVMLRAVVTGKVNPKIVHFRTRVRSDIARMVLANSITLTPATITLDLNDDHLTVHWLFCDTHHMKAAGETVKGRLEPHVQRIWL